VILVIQIRDILFVGTKIERKVNNNFLSADLLCCQVLFIDLISSKISYEK